MEITGSQVPGACRISQGKTNQKTMLASVCPQLYPPSPPPLAGMPGVLAKSHLYDMLGPLPAAESLCAAREGTKQG